ncbi:STAS domain-containing protein [Blastococcus saxobsidens]|uniref:STAS domain-containing protein n=1 Tax=Blastococcus saxobsidens TaxID=138336 RepID=A0A6L9W043_9ACTN|nr:STAS domain-containing protein [Blastococcus saxobsidens]NEK85069.1 STAS domain-containing protein [Blastococcus saxobsidens]
MTDPARAALAITHEPEGGLVLVLRGELDLAGLPGLAPALDDVFALPRQPVVLALDDLTFLDSTGVSLLIRIANHFGTVRTRGAAEPVRRVLEVLGLAGRFGLGEG